MIELKLIFPKETAKGEQLSSNYDIILTESSIAAFFKRLNTQIDIELIEEEYPEIAEGQLDDPFFREYCLNKKPELKSRAQEIRFEQQTIDSLTKLWKHDLFRQVFLPIEALTKAYDRGELPKDPLDLLFGMTSAICEKIFELQEGKVFIEPPFVYLFVNFDINDTLPAILSELDKVANPKDNKARANFRSLIDRFAEVYDLTKEKILAYGKLEDVGSYHIRRLASFLNIDFRIKEGPKK